MFRQDLVCAKVADQNIFPSDIWVVIFRLLNKKDLRETAATCKLLYNIIRDYSLISFAPLPIDYTHLKHNIFFPLARNQRDKILSRPGESSSFEFENGDFAFTNQDIYLWQTGKIKYKVLIGHSDKVLGMISLNHRRIASYDSKGIRIWDAEKASQLHYLPHNVEPIALFYSSERMICVYETGQTDIYDESFHKIKSLTLSYFDSKVTHAKIHNQELILSHQQNTTWITVWNVETGELKKTYDLRNLDKLIHTTIKRPFEVPCIEKFPPHLIVRFRGEKFLLNTNGEISGVLLGEIETTKYATLADGSLLVLITTQDGYRISANYDAITNAFTINANIQHPEGISRSNIPTVMPDGSIVIIYGEYLHAMKWDFKTQKIDPNFKLTKPSLPLIQDYLKPIRVSSLPNGDVLSWYFYYGLFTIHDGATGQIKLTNLFNNRLRRNELKFEKKAQLANGDFVIQYSKFNRHQPPENYINIHRFGFFQEKSAESEQEESLKPPRKRRKTST